MKKMFIYEPAMCCSTGLCGVSIDPELLRISTVINSLKNNGIEVIRFNLSSSTQELIRNRFVEIFYILLKVLHKIRNQGGFSVLIPYLLKSDCFKSVLSLY